MTITHDLVLRPMRPGGDGFSYEFSPVYQSDLFVRAMNIRHAARLLHVPFRDIGHLHFSRRWTLRDYWNWWNRRAKSLLDEYTENIRVVP
jgi:hypothetical protein